MDDDDFDDLLAGVESLQDSSQESLTNAAAYLTCGEVDYESGSPSEICASTSMSSDKHDAIVSTPITPPVEENPRSAELCSLNLLSCITDEGCEIYCYREDRRHV